MSIREDSAVLELLGILYDLTGLVCNSSSSNINKIFIKCFKCYIFPLFSRAGKPPPGLHLDVVKGDKLIEKLIIDEKKYYLFGRNPDLCDFTIDHQSCSRVHAALVYHKHLKRVFLIDLNSTHGTFLGHIRLEAHKPQQIPIDSTVSFGASTRAYTLREKPQTLPSAVKGDEKMGEDVDPSVGRFRNMVQTAVVPVKKKKYAKEAWPGKKPTPSLLI
ncbi:hypothetical protein EK904_003105 [Melospiza melodia maxima]|nr:hypothetical protein EK904_003105 [Melospiza melodia maxima]